MYNNFHYDVLKKFPRLESPLLTMVEWMYFKGLSHGILSYFEHGQTYPYIEENLKIILYKERKTSKR